MYVARIIDIFGGLFRVNHVHQLITTQDCTSCYRIHRKDGNMNSNSRSGDVAAKDMKKLFPANIFMAGKYDAKISLVK